MLSSPTINKLEVFYFSFYFNSTGCTAIGNTAGLTVIAGTTKDDISCAINGGVGTGSLIYFESWPVMSYSLIV